MSQIQIKTFLHFSIFFLAIVLLFFHLGRTYLVSFDEAYYAVMAKEMVKNHDPLTLTFGGEKFFAASPMYIWLEALWFKFLGVSEFGVRFFSAASSFLLLLAVYYYLKITKVPEIFPIVFLVLFSIPKFLYLSRIGNVDATLTLFTTVSFLAAELAIIKAMPKMLLLWGTSAALAFYTKGIFGLFPIATLLLFILIFRRSLLRSKYLYLGLLIFFLFIIPWNFFQIYINGKDFLQGFYGGYMATKFAPISLYNRFWWFASLWQAMKLWFPVSLFILLYGIYSKNLRSRMLFLVFAILLYCSLLSFVRTQNDWYLMPVYPLFAMVIACVFYTFFQLPRFTHLKPFFLAFIVIIAVFQDVHYFNQYVLPQTTDAQVNILRRAEEISKPGQPILLDDYYFPVATFYSSQSIIALRANRDPSAAVPAELLNKKLSQGSVVLSNSTTLESLRMASVYSLVIEKEIGELILLRPVTPKI